MVTNKTLENAVAWAYKKGASDQKMLDLETQNKDLENIKEIFKWRCTKHNECGDMKSICRRLTTEPCIFRKKWSQNETRETMVRSGSSKL